jgi:predicted GNAT family N-acyltransferase
MLIRPARVSDAPDLQDHCFGATRLDDVVTMVERLDASPDSYLMVAEAENSEVVACCSLTRLEHRMCRHRADLSGFVVDSNWQGTGLARQIVSACADLARHDWSTSVLELAVRGDSHAHHAYLGLGFIEWGRLPGGYDDDGVRFDEVAYLVVRAQRLPPFDRFVVGQVALVQRLKIWSCERRSAPFAPEPAGLLVPVPAAL